MCCACTHAGRPGLGFGWCFKLSRVTRLLEVIAVLFWLVYMLANINEPLLEVFLISGLQACGYVRLDVSLLQGGVEQCSGVLL